MPCRRIRLATSNLVGYTPAKTPLEGCRPDMPLVLRWIVSRLNHMVKRSNEAFTAYDFHELAEAGRVFFWEEFCDVFLEYAPALLGLDPHRPVPRRVGM